MRTFLFCTLFIAALLTAPTPSGAVQEEPAEFGKPKIAMAPFNFSLIKQGRVHGKVTIHLTLVIEENGSHEEVRRRLPQVRSDFNSALTVLARQRFSVTKPINPDIVKAYLTPYAVKRLGDDVVSIYVHQALIEPA